MRGHVIGLVSGGKDSIFNMMECVELGYEIVALANLYPQDSSSTHELDSFMYQTVGYTAVQSIAKAMGVHLLQEPITGKPLNQKLGYSETGDDEVEDLYRLLSKAKAAYPSVVAVSSGAILSNYQRLRVENVCERLGLVSLAYMWRRDQREVLDSMMDRGVEAVLVKTACMGLYPREHLGKSLADMRPILKKLADDFGCNEAGEGGEYETIVLYCPLFRKRIILDSVEIAGEDVDDPTNPSGHLRILKCHLEDVVGVSSVSSLCVCDSSSVVPASSGGEDLLPSEEMGTSALVHQVSEFGSFVFWKGSNFANAGSLLETLERDIESIPGFALSNAISVFLSVPQMSQFKSQNDLYRPYFGTNPPIRACIQATNTSNGVSGDVLLSRSTHLSHMHVQSISHWAPACLGPYSQCVEANGIIMLSGVIGLESGTMEFAPNCDTLWELSRTRKHIASILSAVGSDGSEIVSELVFTSSKCNLSVSELVSNPRLCLSVVAQVACLPKNASVEIQVLAVRGSHSRVTIDEQSRSVGDIQLQDLCVYKSSLSYTCHDSQLVLPMLPPEALQVRVLYLEGHQPSIDWQNHHPFASLIQVERIEVPGETNSVTSVVLYTSIADDL